MKSHYYTLLETFLILLSSIFRTSFKSAAEMVIDAGCRKPKWNDDFNHYHWTASGILLADGACVTLTSENYLAPEVGRTKVSCIFENQKLRDIDSKKQTLALRLFISKPPEIFAQSFSQKPILSLRYDSDIRGSFIHIVTGTKEILHKEHS